jgi:hypothetical protein
MPETRKIRELFKNEPVMEGAGVHLNSKMAMRSGSVLKTNG